MSKAEVIFENEDQKELFFHFINEINKVISDHPSLSPYSVIDAAKAMTMAAMVALATSQSIMGLPAHREEIEPLVKKYLSHVLDKQKYIQFMVH